MGRNARTPNAARAQQATSAGTPSDYLKGRRGEEIARLILDEAKLMAEVLSKSPRSTPLTAPERKRALTLATALRPLVQRDNPDFVFMVDLWIERYGKPGAARRGRSPAKRARFAWWMLRFGAGDLAARSEEQLTVTELMAAAAAVGFDKIEWANRKEERDNWRKLHETNLPKDPAALEAEARKKMAQKREASERREVELKREADRLALEQFRADIEQAKKDHLLERLGLRPRDPQARPEKRGGAEEAEENGPESV